MTDGWCSIMEGWGGGGRNGRHLATDRICAERECVVGIVLLRYRRNYRLYIIRQGLGAIRGMGPVETNGDLYTYVWWQSVVDSEEIHSARRETAKWVGEWC